MIGSCCFNFKKIGDFFFYFETSNITVFNTQIVSHLRSGD